MRVESLHLYPIKSTAGLDVAEVTVQPWGFEGDRRWAVIGPDGNRLSVQRHRGLMRVRAVPTPAALRLAADSAAPLDVAFPVGGPRVPVQLSGLDSAVLACGAAAGWLSALLGADARLVWLDDPHLRPVRPSKGGRPGDPLSLADNTPVLLTSQASLSRLNDWIVDEAVARGELPPAPLVIGRFRPNIVIDGDVPFAEDGWSGVRIGGVEFRFASVCDRCAVTTIDPNSLRNGKEPVRTLAKHRKWDGQIWFGASLIPVSGGSVRVGDPVEVTAGNLSRAPRGPLRPH